MKNKSISVIIAALLMFGLGLAVPSVLKRKPPDDVTQLVAGNTDFACNLYSQLKKEKGNLFFSPYSISTALAMTYAGARGNTAIEIQNTLHFTPGERKTHSAFAQLTADLERLQKKGSVQLLAANSLWPQKGYPFLPEYLALIKSDYGVSITPLDYQGQTEPARQTINQWVAEKTHDKIRDIIPQGNLDPLTRLVLVNAIYFNGNWESQFEANQTVKSDFFIAPDTTVQAHMMTQTHSFRYAETHKLQIVELPYIGRELSMLILLPKPKNGLSSIEARLTRKHINQWKKSLSEQEIEIYLPKFRITWGAAELNSPLQQLGMLDAFNEPTADFSGMDGTNRLYISKILHKAFVDANEAGTEAAAATVDEGCELCASIEDPPPVFRADHPFLFLIQENQNGSILFMGRVTDPTASP